MASAAAFAPAPLLANDLAIYGGVSVQSGESGPELFPVLVVETGRLTFGLDKITILLAETEDYDLSAGLSYDQDGTVEAFLNGIAYTPYGIELETEIRTTLSDAGSYATVEIRKTLEVGFAAFTPSFGWQFADAAHRRNSSEGPSAEAFIAISAFVPVSRQAAFIGEITGENRSGSSQFGGIDYSIGLVTEF